MTFRRAADNAKPVDPNKLESLPLSMLVKSATEDASLGISQNSIVTSDQGLIDCVHFVHEHVSSPAIVEEYIDGRELYVGVIANERLGALPSGRWGSPTCRGHRGSPRPV